MTRQEAINAKCKDCIYDPKSGLGNWRQQVEGCTMPDCALWPYRPRSQPKRKSTGVQPEGLRRYAERARELQAQKRESDR